MASGKSDWLENKYLGYVYTGAAFAAPATVHIALFTASPTDAGGGTEVTGGAYTRLSKATTTANFTLAGNTLTNAAVFAWPDATASWGTVVAVGIFDAATGGNLLHWGDLTASKAIASGDRFELAAGALSIQED